MTAPAPHSQPTPEPVRRIDIAWHDGAYYVSIPNWSGGTVVPATDYDALKARVEQAERAVEELEATLRSASAQCGNVIFNCEQRAADNGRHLDSWRGVKEFIDASLPQSSGEARAGREP